LVSALLQKGFLAFGEFLRKGNKGRARIVTRVVGGNIAMMGDTRLTGVAQMQSFVSRE
jgi:hypothetical protein